MSTESLPMKATCTAASSGPLTAVANSSWDKGVSSTIPYSDVVRAPCRVVGAANDLSSESWDNTR